MGIPGRTFHELKQHADDQAKKKQEDTGHNKVQAYSTVVQR